MKITMKEGKHSVTLDTNTMKCYRSQESGVEEKTPSEQTDESDSYDDLFGSMFDDAQDEVGVEQEPETGLSAEQEAAIQAAAEQEVAERNQSQMSKQNLPGTSMNIGGIDNSNPPEQQLTDSQIQNEIDNCTNDNKWAEIENAKYQVHASGDNVNDRLFSDVNKREAIARAVFAGWNFDQNKTKLAYVRKILNSIKFDAQKALSILTSRNDGDKHALYGYGCFGIQDGTQTMKVLNVMANGDNGGYPILMPIALRSDMFSGTKVESSKDEETKKQETKQQTQTASSNNQQSQHKSFMQNVDIKQAGIGAAVVALGALATKLIGGTIYNKVTSIGNFSSGNDMLQSPILNQKLSQLASRYPQPYPSVQDVKNDPRAKSKSTFMGWLLGGSSSAKVMQQAGSINMLVKQVNGIPVSITSIRPLTLNSNKILLATAYFYKNNQIVSVPLARGFLNKGFVVNRTKECADVYFGNTCAFTKKNIEDFTRRTYDIFGPNLNIQKAIISEYCI